MNDYQIVEINVYQTIGAIPSTLQKTGAIVSLQSTRLPVGGVQLITQLSDIKALVGDKNKFTITSLVSDGADLTIEVAEDVLLSAGDSAELTISGAEPQEFNVTVQATYDGNKIFTAPTTISTGVATTPGIATQGQTDADKELLRKFTTFFAQGSRQSVYVIELGSNASALNAAEAYLDDPTVPFYAILIPDIADGTQQLIQIARNHSANEAKVYFFIDTVPTFPSDTPYTSPYKGIKSIVPSAVNDDAPFSPSAALMWNFIGADPSDMNRVPPMAFRYMLGVTPFEATGAQKTQLKSENVNYVGTGAEGGISNTLVVGGVTADGNDMTYWYSVDWIQINVHIALANAVINGSNNPTNPLYYNQDGIDRLQIAAQGQFNSGVSYGLVNGNPVVQAIPFREYLRNNPNDYQIGRYAGMSASYTPMRGFTKIIFNINVTMQLA